jgi:hypothetical protein
MHAAASLALLGTQLGMAEMADGELSTKTAEKSTDSRPVTV